MTALVDTYHRLHKTLRISVTDRCQMRCTYCLPNGAPPPLPRAEILTFEEIVRIIGVAAKLGVTRVRFTGGEPLLRRDLPTLVAMTRAIAPEGIASISLTTNGLLLSKHIDGLVRAGLTHLSISIDSMHRDVFEEMTGVDGLDTVLKAVNAARAHPLVIEMNSVAIKGRSENEIIALVEFSRSTGIPIRFIELMPFEDIEWRESMVLSGVEIEEIIASHYGNNSYEEIARSRPSAPARRFRFREHGAGHSGKVADANAAGGFGLIEPVSKPFCSACDRLRMRSDGMLYNCLFGRTGYDLREPVRHGSDDDIRSVFLRSVAEKGPGGMLEFQEQVTNRARIMASIGG